MSKKSVLISLFISIILISTYAYATVTGNIVAKPKENLKNVKPGDEFQVDLYLDNYSYTNKGVDEFVIKLDVNDEILENLTVDSIVSDNGYITIGDNNLKVEDVNSAKEDQVIFSNLTTDCDYKIFIDLKNAYTLDNYNSNKKIISLKFKVKEDAKVGEIKEVIKYNVDLATQVTAEDLKNNFKADRKNDIKDSVDLIIVNNTEKPQNEVPSNTNDDNTLGKTNTNIENKNINTKNTNKQNTNTKNENQNVNNNTKVDNKNSNTEKQNPANKKAENLNGNISQNISSVQGTTTANKSIPAAGYKVFILPIIFVAGVGFVFYKKYIKYKDI